MQQAAAVAAAALRRAHAARGGRELAREEVEQRALAAEKLRGDGCDAGAYARSLGPRPRRACRLSVTAVGEDRGGRVPWQNTQQRR